MVVHQDLLQRLTGLYRVTVTVLGYGDQSGEESSSSNSVVLPFGRWADVVTVLRAIWPEVDLNLIQPTPQPARAQWLTPLPHAKHTWGVGEDVLVACHGLVEHAMTTCRTGGCSRSPAPGPASEEAQARHRRRAHHRRAGVVGPIN